MLHANDPDHGQRIAQRAGCQYSPEQESVISRTSKAGELLGGVIYSGFTGRSIFTHFAGFHPHWLNRAMLWTIFYYPYVQLDCSNIFCLIRSSNHRALEITKKMGFTKATRIPEVYTDGDAIVNKLSRDDCRWLELKPRTLT